LTGSADIECAAVPEQPYLAFSWKHLPVVLQSTSSECGLACIVMLANFHGIGVDLAALRRRYRTGARGSNLAALIDIAASLGMSARALRCGVDELRKLRLPCILHWEFDHFVVLKRVGRRHFIIHDPARGELREPLARVGDAFTGIALEIARASRVSCSPAPRLTLPQLMRGGRRFVLAALLVGVSSLLAEMLLLAMPFYLQIVVDEVVGRNDMALLNALVTGFGLLVLFQALVISVRQLATQFFTQTVIFDLSSRLVDYLLETSLRYFRDRELGEVQSRVMALGPIQAFVTQSAPALLLDGLFLVLVTALLSGYDARVAGVAIATAAAFFCWRLLTAIALLRRSRELALADANTQSHLLATLRVIETIRLNGAEALRASAWRNRLAERSNAEIRMGFVRIADAAVQHLLFQGLQLAAIYLLAVHVQQGRMTVGAMSAIVVYLGMFVARVTRVVDRVLEYRLLRVPLERISDIVFADRGRCAGAPVAELDFTGAVSLRGVGFRYASNEAPLLKCCNLHVGSGEFVVIRGVSGIGKSTVLRLLAGIETPDEGYILYDDRRVPAEMLRSLRRHIATVLDGDDLVRGSIGDNIALFDPSPSRRRMRRVAEVAGIDRDIELMPMGYESPVHDMSCAFSRGQKQRLLLARAIYRQPKLLLLDEFTSGLDADTERRVLSSLSGLAMTCIVASHSDAVMRFADRVLELRAGRLEPVNPGRVGAPPSSGKPAAFPRPAGTDP